MIPVAHSGRKPVEGTDMTTKAIRIGALLGAIALLSACQTTTMSATPETPETAPASGSPASSGDPFLLPEPTQTAPASAS